MSSTLTGGAISTVYKKLAFTKTTSGVAGDLFYTDDADGVTDNALTTLTSPMTFSGKITSTSGIELDNGLIYDSGGNEAVYLTTTGGAVNYLNVVPSATGNAVQLASTGSDTNVGLTLDCKGSGGITTTPLLTATAGVKLGNNIIYASDGGETISLDTSDNVTILGDLKITGGDIYGTTDGDLMIHSDGHMDFRIDSDNDESTQKYRFYSDNDVGTIAELDESGNLQIDGDLTLSGGNITTALTLDSTLVVAGASAFNANMTIGDGLDFKFYENAGFEIKSDGGTAYMAFTASNMTFSSAKTLTLAGTTTISGLAKFTGNTGNTPGSGITGGSGTICKVYTERFGSMVKTTLYIDLDGLQSNGATGAVIGVDGTSNPCYLTQITAAINGTVVSGRMSCLEVPAGGDTDINLSFSTDADDVESAALTDNTVLVDRAGAWAVNDVRAFTTATQVITADDYLYLVTGDTASDSEYTGGKFLIEIWGTA